jgi:hypothetical protein
VVVLVALPPGVVTAIFPGLAPVGTRSVTRKSEFTVKEVTFTPPTVRPNAWINPVPVSTIESPAFPLVGAKLVTLGVTLKILLLNRAPEDVVTMTNPVSPLGTIAVR